MPDSKHAHPQNDEIPLETNFVNQESDRQPKRTHNYVSNSDVLSSSDLREAESNLQQSIGIIKEGHILRHWKHTQSSDEPKCMFQHFQIFTLYRLWDFRIGLLEIRYDFDIVALIYLKLK